MTSTDALRAVPNSPSWPSEFEELNDPPNAIWLRGQLELLEHRPRIAIVGTRAPSPYGQAQAARFAAHFARAGLCMVSGLARGIDQVAHWAALNEGGATIAVLGCGVDRPWPKCETTNAMIERGLLLSEFSPGTPPRPYHFPLRNRLISGLASAVVVIEAAARSGSLITAHWAADQGRDVYALPGRVDHPMSRGTHKLIREGATLVESPDEVLEELAGFAAPKCAEAKRSREEESPLLRALRGETLSASELAKRLKRGIGDTLSDLVREELKGRVVRAPGGLYRLSNLVR